MNSASILQVTKKSYRATVDRAEFGPDGVDIQEGLEVLRLVWEMDAVLNITYLGGVLSDAITSVYDRDRGEFRG